MRPVLIDGGGHGDENTGPGTTLIFPTDYTGIRFHSSDPAELLALAGAHDDVPDGLPIYRTGASQSELRSMTVRCDVERGPVRTGPGWRDVYDVPIRANIDAYGHHGHGIHTSTVIVLRDLFVQNFAEHGVYVAAAHGDDAIGGHPGNAAGTHLVNVVSSKHGGHGFFFIGGDANVSLIEMCAADLNYGNGFREYAGTGNTYVACYGQANAGMIDNVGATELPNFESDYHNHDFYVVGSGVNYSTFFGCYSEASIDRIIFPASAFGGNISGENFTISSATGFGLLGGVMSGGPLKYRSRSSFPNSSFINIGTYPTSPDDVLLLGRLIDGNERSPTTLTYEGKTRRWSLYSEGVEQGPVMEVPTRESKRYDRYPAPSFPNGIFIGAAVAGIPDDPSQISRCHWRIAPLPPSATDTVGLAATYKTGDVIWQSNPVPGGALGQVCLQSGTQTQLRVNPATTGTILMASLDHLTLSQTVGFAVGKYVTIQGLAGVFEITGYDPVDPMTAIISPTAPSAVAPLTPVNVVMVVTSIDVADASKITVDDSTGLAPGRFITVDGGRYEVKGLGTAAYLECRKPQNYDFSVPPVPLGPFTLDVWIDLRGVQTVTFSAADFPLASMVTAAQLAGVLTNWFTLYGAGSARADGSGGVVRITSNTTGENSRVAVTGGTANTELGFITDNITRVFGTTETFPMAGESFTLSVDGGVTSQTITFGADGPEDKQQKVIATINAAMGFDCAVARDSTHLVLEAQARGTSVIISGPAMGSALTKLGFVAGTTQFYFPSMVDTTNVTLTSAALFAAPPPPQAVQYKPATFGTFGKVVSHGTREVDVSVATVLDAVTANSDTIRLTGTLAANTTITVPSLDGWGARILDRTARAGFLLEINAETAAGMVDYALTNQATQRMYIEYDPVGLVYNMRPESPAI